MLSLQKLFHQRKKYQDFVQQLRQSAYEAALDSLAGVSKTCEHTHASKRFTVPGEPSAAISIKPLEAGPVDRFEVYLRVVRRK